jgi:Tetratricopeptide repeat
VGLAGAGVSGRGAIALEHRAGLPAGQAHQVRLATALGEQLGDRRGLAEALVGLGETAMVQGRHQQARPLFEQARAGFRSIGNPHGVAVATVQIGLCALEGGGPDEARALVREGLRLARQLEFRWGELYGLDGAALLAARTGSWEVAATLLGATELPREQGLGIVRTCLESQAREAV